jgi:hypothetical protein
MLSPAPPLQAESPIPGQLCLPLGPIPTHLFGPNTPPDSLTPVLTPSYLELRLLLHPPWHLPGPSTGEVASTQ